MKTKQEEKNIPATSVEVVEDYIILSNFLNVPMFRIPFAERDDLIDKLKCCNVATVKLVNPKTSLFDSSADSNVYTLEIDEKILTDFQTLRQSVGEDIRKTLTALIEYHSEHDALNLILLHDTLENRQSYIKFTAQLANYLTHAQPRYTQVKVQFDPLTTRLGIFCRLGSPGSTLNSTFLGSVVATLRVHKSAEVLTEDIPMSYLGNRAALKYQLTQKLGKRPILQWSKTSLKVFI